MEKEARLYEIGYLLSSLVPEEKLDEKVSFLRKKIEDKKGFIMSEARPKMLRLAYPVNKNETAFLGWIKFMMEGETLLELKNIFDTLLKEEGKIIRFVIVKSFKDEAMIKTVKRAPRAKKEFTQEASIKEEIKPEEIDKKLEELLAA
jgi:ribosomal protein S6